MVRVRISGIYHRREMSWTGQRGLQENELGRSFHIQMSLRASLQLKDTRRVLHRIFTLCNQWFSMSLVRFQLRQDSQATRLVGSGKSLYNYSRGYS